MISTALSTKTSTKTYDWIKNNSQLINVGVTRAKENLIVVTDLKAIDMLSRKDDDLYALIEYATNNGTTHIAQSTVNKFTIGFSNNSKFEDIYSFKSGEITNLLFPLDNADVNIPKLAMWRIGTHEVFGGTWLSDYIDNRLSDKEEVVNNESQEVIKPDCELIGQDSNIFNLMGIAARTLRENGLDEQAKEMIDKVTNSGSYNEALLAISDYVNIVGPDESEDEGMCMG